MSNVTLVSVLVVFCITCRMLSDTEKFPLMFVDWPGASSGTLATCIRFVGCPCGMSNVPLLSVTTCLTLGDSEGIPYQVAI